MNKSNDWNERMKSRSERSNLIHGDKQDRRQKGGNERPTLERGCKLQELSALLCPENNNIITLRQRNTHKTNALSLSLSLLSLSLQFRS